MHIASSSKNISDSPKQSIEAKYLVDIDKLIELERFNDFKKGFDEILYNRLNNSIEGIKGLINFDSFFEVNEKIFTITNIQNLLGSDCPEKKKDRNTKSQVTASRNGEFSYQKI